MLEGGAMSRIEIEKKICELRKRYMADIEGDKEQLADNIKEYAKMRNKAAYFQQKVCELKQERIIIQQRMNAKCEKFKKEVQTQRENLKALEQAGLI